MDAEHQHLFTLVKALTLASVQQTVEELLDYVVVHFSNEQALMERSGYPAFEQHLKLHEDFAGHVADFLGSGDSWTEERVQELRRFLNKWLVGHIMTHDLRFGKWYAEHLVPEKAQEAPYVTLADKAVAIKSQLRPRQRSESAEKHRGFFASLFGLR
ncbi:hemerythrin family protein [Noviherbaspirillum sp.]|uniref:bacteriohemerythrin n=1 Tax=Noviherbaspirillum sp. TaxID=1926288 RepID=UPI002B47D8B6|nr:hemerythrin family protein [Noviherbaspirillum sp.]HJV81087.1 hemerythrin family protein [Noviherbaspirillum sp.]